MKKKSFLLLAVQLYLTTFSAVWCLDESTNEIIYEDGLEYEDKALNYTDDAIIELLADIYNSANSIDETFSVSSRFFTANPEFWLYTRENADLKKLQTGNKTDLLQSTFNFNRKTWFILHGWMGNGNSPNVQLLKTAYLNKWNVNVIIVDWSTTAFNLYSFARFKINDMALKLYDFLSFLVTNGYSLNDVNMVGHSLGAHIAGLAAKRLGDELVASITGIDAAWPLFYADDPNGRLSKTDAKYVEVIHSNAGFLGFLTPIGDTDIYINGGTFQPECGIFIAMCPHVRGFVRYIETISNDKDYLAYKCNGYESALIGNCPKDVTLRVGGALPKSWYACCVRCVARTKI